MKEVLEVFLGWMSILKVTNFILPNSTLLLVYHDCQRTLPCQRKVDLKIPDQYVTRTPKVEQWFEAGTMNMEFKFANEETSCIN